MKTDDEQMKNAPLSLLSQETFNEKFIISRVKFSLDLSSPKNSTDVKDTIVNVTERMLSACFHLKKEELILEENGILVGGSEYSGRKVLNLLSQEKKKGYSNLRALNFDMYENCSKISSSWAPLVKGPFHDVSLLSSHLKAQSISYISRDSLIEDMGKFLCQSVLKHIKLAEYWLLKACDDKDTGCHLSTVNILPYRAGHAFSLMYPSEMTDAPLKPYRAKLQESFLLPPNCPFFGRKNAYEFCNDKESYHLYNTHIGLEPPKVKGLTSITKGIYSYHHYMQDKFNDNKWGCAYRSLQTIISWFRHQGYTDKLVPTHRQIQECLVRIGDRPAKFIGSNQWIGSMEVGYVLESYLGVTSRFISVNSGADLGDKGRELVHHFKTQGTPVMIGGGVLAHTILGVTWNSDTGDISYLILDPHYTGEWPK